MSAAELVKAAQKLPPREFADFVIQIDVLRARHRAPCLPAVEAKLLQQINRGFSDSWWKRYRNLIEKRQNESLTENQRIELVRLTNTIEKREAKRLAALAELAGRRRLSLTDLMRQLGLIETCDA